MQENSESGNFCALEKKIPNLHKDEIEGNMQIRSEAEGSDLHKVNDSGAKMQSGLKVETFGTTKVSEDPSISGADSDGETEIISIQDIKEDCEKPEFYGSSADNITADSEKETNEQRLNDDLKGGIGENRQLPKVEKISVNVDKINNDSIKKKPGQTSSFVKIKSPVVLLAGKVDLKQKNKNILSVSNKEENNVSSKKQKLESLVSGLNFQKVGFVMALILFLTMEKDIVL